MVNLRRAVARWRWRGIIGVVRATVTGEREHPTAPLPTGRVRVTVVLLPATQSKAPFLVKLEAIHQALCASGYRPRTEAQIDAEIQAERESWGA